VLLMVVLVVMLLPLVLLVAVVVLLLLPLVLLVAVVVLLLLLPLLLLLVVLLMGVTMPDAAGTFAEVSSSAVGGAQLGSTLQWEPLQDSSAQLQQLLSCSPNLLLQVRDSVQCVVGEGAGE
jgi:hypothetical protein